MQDEIWHACKAGQAPAYRPTSGRGRPWAIGALAAAALALSLAACQDVQQAQQPQESQQSQETGSDAAAPTTQEVVEPSASAQDEADQAAGLTDYTGTLQAANTPEQISVSMGDGVLALSGQVSASPSSGLSSYTLGYDGATTWTASGGEAGEQEVSASDFEQLLEAQNGLGLILQVSGGHVDKATMAS